MVICVAHGGHPFMVICVAHGGHPFMVHVLLLCCSDQRRRGSHASIHPSVEAKKADDRDRGCPLGSIQLAFSYSPQTPALLVTLTDIMLLSSKVLFSGENWVWSRESWVWSRDS